MVFLLQEKPKPRRGLRAIYDKKLTGLLYRLMKINLENPKNVSKALLLACFVIVLFVLALLIYKHTSGLPPPHKQILSALYYGNSDELFVENKFVTDFLDL